MKTKGLNTYPFYKSGDWTHDKPITEKGNQWYWVAFACVAWTAISMLVAAAWLL